MDIYHFVMSRVTALITFVAL